jgi:hypothetical protein
MTIEQTRLHQDRNRTHQWKRWGPYLSERQWGTVREDYSPNGDSWDSFPHEHARSRAFRWGEDGLLGFCDRQCRLCFGLALWNGQDSILKERLFGLTGPEGNHGEDVKECYYYLDSTPTHSYAKALYKYPQAAFPYEHLVRENRNRGVHAPEFELEDTGIFDEGRYFDVFVEYAKAAPEDICIRVTVANRGPDNATLHLLPNLWFRNTWSWGSEVAPRPQLKLSGNNQVLASHSTLGEFVFAWEGDATPLFTENESNAQLLWDTANVTPFVKDAFHEAVVHDRTEAVNPENFGTKCAPHFVLSLAAGEQRVVQLRLVLAKAAPEKLFGPTFDEVFRLRLIDAEEFHSSLNKVPLSPDAAAVSRQARAGLLWSKQYYHYVISEWLKGDPGQPSPPAERQLGRNSSWTHFHANDLLSMPDKWEYPWFAAWDLAFHMIPMAELDPDFAKQQLSLLLREWYMHPNGQLAAYEFGFHDVNPPVHAWAAWRVYKMTAARGERDRAFLESVFQKLLLNFTWWVNRKDSDGNNLFQGGFLGLDNIGVFDRSQGLPTGGHLLQSDGTAWMAFYSLTMLSMALELAKENSVYEDLASKFFEHYVSIAEAINSFGGNGLWEEADGFYYDKLSLDGRNIPLTTRSLVGLLPLIAVEVLEEEQIQKLPGFRKRMQWFMEHREELSQNMTLCRLCGHHEHRLLAIPSRERLERILRRMLDESEFLSPHGLRSLSRAHGEHPFVFREGSVEYRVDYVPGESNSYLFGGNSNWRGPVWFPINYLIIEALERYAHFHGPELTVEYPTGSGVMMTLDMVAAELSRRHGSLFLADADGNRPCHGGASRYANDPHWKELILFHEYFHGETGRGCGASHQTGWTTLVVRCLQMTRTNSDAVMEVDE